MSHYSKSLYQFLWNLLRMVKYFWEHYHIRFCWVTTQYLWWHLELTQSSEYIKAVTIYTKLFAAKWKHTFTGNVYLNSNNKLQFKKKILFEATKHRISLHLFDARLYNVYRPQSNFSSPSSLSSHAHMHRNNVKALHSHTFTLGLKFTKAFMIAKSNLVIIINNIGKFGIDLLLVNVLH